jgi:predicted O-methyltransferase YrrM
MNPAAENNFEQCYAKILAVFTELGYPQDLIGQWSLPPQDAKTLMDILQDCHPDNVLEVGTFVGMTTLMMALMSPPETHIHSIDPNFPLKVEMESMRSNLFDFDTSIKAQDLALLAAQRLGIDHKITFHAGGFSTNNTFASYNTSPSTRISIVGPDICKQYGPFDFIFIDGLHYEEDVYSDIILATQYIIPSKIIAIHDVLGRWGSNVRRAIFRFLEDHEDFHFSHGHYSKVFESIGLLHFSPWDPRDYQQPIDREIKLGSIIQEKLLSNLAALLVNVFNPASVVQIGGNVDLLKNLKDLGVSEVVAFIPDAQGTEDDSIPLKVFNPQDSILLDKRYDLCICLEFMDILPQESVDKVMGACVEASDTIVFASSPPGEMGKYQLNNKPLTYWIKKFYKKGYLFHDVIRPVIEPHVEVLYAENYRNSSYLLNLYLVKRDRRLDSDTIDKAFFEEVIVRQGRRIEDLELQNLYQKCIIQKEITLKIIDNYEVLHREYNNVKNYYESIHLFNKKVLGNSIKRVWEILCNLFSGKKIS